MASAYINVRSAAYKSVLIKAIDFVNDFEGDMCHDLSLDLGKQSGSEFDETLREIANMRRRINACAAMKISCEAVAIGEKIYVSPLGLEVLDRGLEFLADTINHEIVEPFYGAYKLDTDFVSIEYLKQIQKKVEDAVDELLACQELLAEVRRIIR